MSLRRFVCDSSAVRRSDWLCGVECVISLEDDAKSREFVPRLVLSDAGALNIPCESVLLMGVSPGESCD
jgi:peptidyl-tRNA hydrolase